MIPGFCVVAQMGRRESFGYTEEAELCGVKMLKITLPAVEGDADHDPLPETTELIHPQSLYSVTQTTPEMCVQRRMVYRPWKVVILQIEKSNVCDCHGLPHHSCPDEQAKQCKRG